MRLLNGGDPGKRKPDGEISDSKKPKLKKMVWLSVLIHCLTAQKSSNGTFVDEEGDGEEDAEASGPLFVPIPTDFTTPLLQEYAIKN